MTNRETARPLDAPTNLETLHIESGRYVRLLPSSSPLPVDAPCEACDRSHDEAGHPVRTYHDAADVFDLCDDCALESAAHASWDEGEDDVYADYVTFADDEAPRPSTMRAELGDAVRLADRMARLAGSASAALEDAGGWASVAAPLEELEDDDRAALVAFGILHARSSVELEELDADECEDYGYDGSSRFGPASFGPVVRVRLADGTSVVGIVDEAR